MARNRSCKVCRNCAQPVKKRRRAVYAMLSEPKSTVVFCSSECYMAYYGVEWNFWAGIKKRGRPRREAS